LGISDGGQKSGFLYIYPWAKIGRKKIVKRCRSQALFYKSLIPAKSNVFLKIIEKSKSPGFSIKKRMEVCGYSKIVIRFGGNRQLGAWGLYRANLGFWAFWGYRVGNRKTSPRRQNQVG